MLEAKIHKEITEYEGKIFFGMTGKQIICLIIAVAIVVPLFFLLYPHIGVEITGYICIIVAVPIVAVGFFKYKGHTFIEMLKLIKNYYFKNQKKKCVNIVITDYFEKEDDIKNGSRNHRKIKPGYECSEDTRYCFYAGTKKQKKQKRKEIKKYFKEYKKAA